MMKRYPAYKDSGVEWIGIIPTGWNVTKLKYVTEIETGNTPPKSDPNNYDGGEFLWVKPDNLNGLTEITDSKEKLTMMGRELSRVVPKGSVLVNCIGNIGKMGIAGCELSTNQQINSIIFNAPKLIQEYGKHVVISSKDEHERLSSQVVVAILSKSTQSDIEIPLPPLPEQRTIAAYLDRKTQEIDTLIEKKQALIALLREQRTALLNRAVTKGLNPDVPMKDSGIEWLGEVPAHWKVPHIRFVARMDSGHTPSRKIPEYWKECTIPWVSLSDTKTLAAVDYISETHYTISELGMANSSAHLIESGTVVFTRDATIGLAAIPTRPMAVSQHIIAWICGERVENKFLLYVIYAMTDELERLTMGATLKTIGMPDVKELKMPLPPIDEQQNIISFLDVKRGQIDETINREQQLIELLQELRTSLISEVVTGKIDVRDDEQTRRLFETRRVYYG